MSSNILGIVRLSLIVLVAAGASGALLSACAPTGKIASALFEPLPAPQPVVHQPRRKPYEPPKADAPVVEFKEAPPPIDWTARATSLPKTAAGGIDWVTALNDKLIEPKAGLEEGAEPEPELDLDVELIPKDMPEFKVVYPHKIHTKQLACANCHTAIFQMQAGADPITMEKIFGGEYCGRCHGKVSFEPIAACWRCHRAMPQ